MVAWDDPYRFSLFFLLCNWIFSFGGLSALRERPKRAKDMAFYYVAEIVIFLHLSDAFTACMRSCSPCTNVYRVNTSIIASYTSTLASQPVWAPPWSRMNRFLNMFLRDARSSRNIHKVSIGNEWIQKSSSFLVWPVSESGRLWRLPINKYLNWNLNIQKKKWKIHPKHPTATTHGVFVWICVVQVWAITNYYTNDERQRVLFHLHSVGLERIQCVRAANKVCLFNSILFGLREKKYLLLYNYNIRITCHNTRISYMWLIIRPMSPHSAVRRERDRNDLSQSHDD